MIDLVKYLVKNLVDQPSQVNITSSDDETGLTTIFITVDDQDMGRIIGKNGKIISAIRELAKVKAVKSSQRVKIVLAEPQTDQPSPSAPQE